MAAPHTHSAHWIRLHLKKGKWITQHTLANISWGLYTCKLRYHPKSSLNKPLRRGHFFSLRYQAQVSSSYLVGTAKRFRQQSLANRNNFSQLSANVTGQREAFCPPALSRSEGAARRRFHTLCQFLFPVAAAAHAVTELSPLLLRLPISSIW